MNCGNNVNLKLIQGDTLNLTINVNEGLELIQKMYFTSKELALNIEAEYFGENNYRIIIPSELTKDIKISNATFDITVITIDNHTITSIYNGFIYIYEKENVLNE